MARVSIKVTRTHLCCCFGESGRRRTCAFAATTHRTISFTVHV